MVIPEEQVPDPNGLTFSPDFRQLYVASTGKGPGDTGPGGKGEVYAFDVGPDNKVSADKVQSFKGVTVPGTVAGLYEAHKRFGKLKWAQVIQPTVDLAAKGLVMTGAAACAGLADSMANGKR